MKHLEQIGRGLLPVIAYGDAAGLPTEMQYARNIAAKHGYIDRLIPPTDNPYYTGNFPAGTTSDDTQLSVVVAKALLAADGFTIESQVKEHLDVFRVAPKERRKDGSLSVRGWGGSTTASMERMDAGVPALQAGEPNGSGNGVVMKMAPLVYWQAARDIATEERHEQYDRLTKMTHGSEIASACTRLHGDILFEIMNNPGMSMADFTEMAGEFVKSEQLANYKNRITLALDGAAQTLEDLIVRYADNQPNGKYGFYVPNTLAMVYDVFLAAEGNYIKAVQLAANLGGDSDSIASITGTMCHAWSAGQFERPADYEQVQDYEKLAVLSSRLTKAALSLT